MEPDEGKEVRAQLPSILFQFPQDELEELLHLAETRAWYHATVIGELTDYENTQVAQIEKKYGHTISRQARQRLYNRHHWKSLKAFLFGCYIDIPIATDPSKTWDPRTNPYIKVKIPGWAFTQDEHDEVSPFKRLPDKDYLRAIAYTWVHEPRLLIPKSRQVMITWLFCCIAAHEHLFRSARRSAFISKKFDDANALLDRVMVVKAQLPKDRFEVPQVRRVAGLIECAETSSIIQAMSEEARELRSYTFSWIFSDELAFQEQAGEIIRAAMPTIQKDRFTGVSSVNGEDVFHAMVTDGGRIPAPAGAG